jgi:hypothetical protein
VNKETAYALSSELTAWEVSHSITVVCHPQHAPSPVYRIVVDTFPSIQGAEFRAFVKLAEKFSMVAEIHELSHGLHIQDPPPPHREIVEGKRHSIPKEYLT